MANTYKQDAGHGGADPGCNGFGVQEKAWTLEAARYVNDRLNDLGIKSGLTRAGDTTISDQQRVNSVKAGGTDICISHHLNAFNGSAHGAETIHSIHSNGKLARMMADEMKATGQNIRRVFSREGRPGSDYYYMHRLTGNVQTIIVEYFFLDNKAEYEQYKVKAERVKLYEAVVKAICDYEKIPYKSANVAKPAAAKPAAQNEIHRVQIGAFGNKENAEKLAAELRKKGYETIIK